MNFKIDTKDAFYVIYLNTPQFTAKLAEEIIAEVTKSQKEMTKSLVLNLELVTSIEKGAIESLDKLYENTIGKRKSFVLCCMDQHVKEYFFNANLLEKINHTPTESEAWDIVQMEEIERELDTEFD
jgi:anti-anti-sigma regulatory factor